MKKADYKFYRDRKEQIQRDSSQSATALSYFQQASNSPVYIPKKKKFKK